MSTTEAVLIMNKRNTHMAARLYTLLVSQASLRLFKIPMIDIRSNKLKVWGFIYVVIRFAILAIYFEINLAYIVAAPATRYIR